MASSVTAAASLLLFGRYFENHFVVHLEDEPAGETGGVESGVQTHQRDLEDVGGQTLDAHVHGLAFARLADPVVVRRQLRDLAPAPEQRFGVAALARLGHGALHVLLHIGEGDEVRGEDLGRLLYRDVEALGQSVGLHAVGQTVGNHLGLAALGDGDVGVAHAVDPRGGGGVDVGPRW